MHQIVALQLKNFLFIAAIGLSSFNKPTLETKQDYVLEICLYFIGSSIGAAWKYIANKRKRNILNVWEVISEIFVSYTLALVVNYYLLAHPTGYDRFFLVVFASFVSVDFLLYVLKGFPRFLNGIVQQLSKVDMSGENVAADEESEAIAANKETTIE